MNLEVGHPNIQPITLTRGRKQNLPTGMGGIYQYYGRTWGFPGGSDGKDSVCNVGDWVQSLSGEDPLEKGMAAHTDILAWRILWTGESSELQSMGYIVYRDD